MMKLNLPLAIAERQKQSALEVLKKAGLWADIETQSVPAPSPGTFIFLMMETEGCRTGFSAIGERRKRAEVVGAEAATALTEYSSSGACLDVHLGDQLVLYLALADGASSFTTSSITEHLLTNLHVVQTFLNMSFAVLGHAGGPGRVTIEGIGYSQEGRR